MRKQNLLDGKKILIVDDEIDVLETLEELLPQCKVSKASNFVAAKNLLETRHFDIVILDIMGVNGYELLQIANNNGVIAIMLTANAMSVENTVKAFKQGAASYVPKDKMTEISVFLEDVLEAEEKGKHPWWRWLDRMSSYYINKFGPHWQKKDKDFWKNFDYYI